MSNIQLTKDNKLSSAIKLAMHNFANEFNVTVGKYFPQILNFKNPSQLTNLFLPYEQKFMKVEELFLLLDSLGTHNKIILDYICSRYDYVCSHKANTNNNDEEYIKDLLLNVVGANGTLIHNFNESYKDNNLDEIELKELIKKSYQTRALLNQLEEDLKIRLKNLQCQV